MKPGMIPILHSPGLMMPGQLGPISLGKMKDYLDFDCDIKALLTLTISWIGMPSVMATIRPISASMASRIAAAAPAGGT